jgi:hypothetical protein
MRGITENTVSALEYLRQQLRSVNTDLESLQMKYKCEVFCVGPVNPRVIDAACYQLGNLRQKKQALMGSIKYYETHTED